MTALFLSSLSVIRMPSPPFMDFASIIPRGLFVLTLSSIANAPSPRRFDAPVIPAELVPPPAELITTD